MATSNSGEIAARLDRLVFSASLKKLVVLISLGGAFEFYDLFMTAYIAPGLTASHLFTTRAAGFFCLTASAFSSFAPLRACGSGHWSSAQLPIVSAAAPSLPFRRYGIPSLP
jgi:hypothetical protein